MKAHQMGHGSEQIMIKSDEYMVRVLRGFPYVHRGDVLKVPDQLHPAKAARLVKGKFVEVVQEQEQPATKRRGRPPKIKD